MLDKVSNTTDLRTMQKLDNDRISVNNESCRITTE